MVGHPRPRLPALCSNSDGLEWVTPDVSIANSDLHIVKCIQEPVFLPFPYVHSPDVLHGRKKFAETDNYEQKLRSYFITFDKNEEKLSYFSDEAAFQQRF